MSAVVISDKKRGSLSPPNEDLTAGTRNVTFKMPERRRPHRRAKSDPHIPLSASRLLSEEISQLQKKKYALEQGREVSRGWDKREVRKLQGAIEIVLDEKRKSQLKTLKRRSERLERRRSLNDIKSKVVDIEATRPRPFTRSRSHRQTLSKQEDEKPNWYSADAKDLSALARQLQVAPPSAKFDLLFADLSELRTAAEAPASTDTAAKQARYMATVSSVFDLRGFYRANQTSEAVRPSSGEELGAKGTPGDSAQQQQQKKRMSWEKHIFTKQKSKVFKSKPAPSTAAPTATAPDKRPGSGRVSPPTTAATTATTTAASVALTPSASSVSPAPTSSTNVPAAQSVTAASATSSNAPTLATTITQTNNKPTLPSSNNEKQTGTGRSSPPDRPLPALPPERHSRVAAPKTEQGRVSPRLQERCEYLDRWMMARPAWPDVFEKRGRPKKKFILPGEPGSKKEKEFKSHTVTLESLLQRRPSMKEVMDRGIVKDEKREQKKDKGKSKILNLLRIRKEKESEASGPGVDVYFELGHKGDPTVTACHSVTAGEEEESSNGTAYREINFFHLDFVGRIGGGSYGNVYEAFLQGEKNKVAVKILKNDLRAPEKAYKREVEALKRTAKSPHTVNLRGYCTDPYYCIITELCEGGSLESVMRVKGQRLTLDQALHVARQVAEGLRYLHSLKPPILHRDISLGNIFLQPSVDGRACIGDFGIAVEKTKRGSIRFSKNGNPRYRAPEVSRGEPYSRKADVYSFGNLFYELVTHLRPFHDIEDNKVADLITRGETPKFPDDCGVPDKMKALISDCWKTNPQERPSFKKILARLEKIAEEREPTETPAVVISRKVVGAVPVPSAASLAAACGGATSPAAVAAQCAAIAAAGGPSSAMASSKH